MEKTQNTVVSGVKVGKVVDISTSKPVVMQRKLRCETIANDIASRVTGKLVGFDDLYDVKTGRFLTESELKAKGSVFFTINFDKVMVPNSNDALKKGRTTKEPTPFIRKTSKYQVIGNINWTSYVNKRGTVDFNADEKASNGIIDHFDCNAVGKKEVKGINRHYVKGVAFRSLEPTKYYDNHGNELDRKYIESEYLKVANQASKQKEADKHGIAVKFDPAYRSTRIDSCKSIRAFGFEYIPTD